MFSVYKEMKAAGLTHAEMLGEIAAAVSVFAVPMLLYFASELVSK